jgi:hypothetical protein
MYRFKLFYSVESSLISSDVDTFANCTNCSHVTPTPTHCATDAGSDDSSQCLWDAPRDDWVSSDTI